MKFAVYPPPEPELPFLAVIVTDEGAVSFSQAVDSVDQGWRLIDHLAKEIVNRQSK